MSPHTRMRERSVPAHSLHRPPRRPPPHRLGPPPPCPPRRPRGLGGGLLWGLAVREPRTAALTLTAPPLLRLAAPATGGARNRAYERRSSLYRRMFRVGLMSSMNSIRADCRVRKTPSMAEVTAFEVCFSTPRIIMQR